MGLMEEKYVSVATFRRSGVAVLTPTWIVPLADGRAGFWTSSATGKVKRLRNNPRVTVQPCSQRGKVIAGTVPVPATAVLVTAGAEFDEIQTKIRAKYGVMVPISRFFNTVGHLGRRKAPYGDTGVVMTLDSD